MAVSELGEWVSELGEWVSEESEWMQGNKLVQREIMNECPNEWQSDFSEDRGGGVNEWLSEWREGSKGMVSFPA